MWKKRSSHVALVACPTRWGSNKNSRKLFFRPCGSVAPQGARAAALNHFLLRSNKKALSRKERTRQIRPCQIAVPARYDQFLVAWDMLPIPKLRQVSWLMALHTGPPSQRKVSGMNGPVFPNHSDEIVQDLHLFPFYPPAPGANPCGGTAVLLNY